MYVSLFKMVFFSVFIRESRRTLKVKYLLYYANILFLNEV